MTFRRLLLLAALVAFGAVGAWLWLGWDGVPSEHIAKPQIADHSHGTISVPPTSTAPAQAAPLTRSVAPGAPLVRTESTTPNSIADKSAPAVTPRPDAQPEARAELESVRFMVRDFQTRMHENPVGSNAEIMRAVMGGNPAGAMLGPPAGQSLNADGELVDRWGTPYFFHQLSKTSMEIRSAGPDRQLWTTDDLVTK